MSHLQLVARVVRIRVVRLGGKFGVGTIRWWFRSLRSTCAA